jgi:hypothetical protein
MRVLTLVFAAAALRIARETKLSVNSLTEEGVPSFDSVITMLTNLVGQIENEETSDEADYTAFKTWFTGQSDATSSSITMLSSRLQELHAVIADLESRQHTLSTEVTRLNGEIDMTQSQMEQAKDKRTEEHESFVQEQLDFDNSIKACQKAVEMLQKYYGDGTPKESTRPAWMSLVSTLQALHLRAAAAKHPIKKIEAFLQASAKQVPGMRGSTLNDAHVDSTDDALSIVDQVQELGNTFADDKQSSVDQETELDTAFQSLMAQKTQQLNSLVSQRDTQQSILTQVNQELGENQNAEATAKATLIDEQTYLSAIQAQESDTTMMYEQRVKDRAEEKQAVNGAVGVLQKENPSLLQKGARRARRGALKHAARALKAKSSPVCEKCRSAALYLRQQAASLHSELLATAAMATGSGQTLGPVITQLHDLVGRLDDQQKAEEEHKEWCENELAVTAQTKSKHEMIVAQLKTKIEDTEGDIADKEQSIKDTAEAIQDADTEYTELKGVRAKAKADFEAEHGDYKDAISALNQAIDLLGDFYRSADTGFVQADQVYVPDGAGRNDAPSMGITGSYQKKGGAAVVKILADTRKEFSVGMDNLERQEAQQVADFGASTDAYKKTRADLVDAGNRLSAELQAAQLSLTQLKTDLKDNEDKVTDAENYLIQVGGSCNMLIKNFDERTKLRDDEKTAIQNAIQVLQSAV